MNKTEELREKVTQAVGEYSATIMVENPSWIFNTEQAIELVNQIMKLFIDTTQELMTSVLPKGLEVKGEK